LGSSQAVLSTQLPEVVSGANVELLVGKRSDMNFSTCTGAIDIRLEPSVASIHGLSLPHYGMVSFNPSPLLARKASKPGVLERPSTCSTTPMQKNGLSHFHHSRL
jgi:hypothetical protein